MGLVKESMTKKKTKKKKSRRRRNEEGSMPSFALAKKTDCFVISFFYLCFFFKAKLLFEKPFSRVAPPPNTTPPFVHFSEGPPPSTAQDDPLETKENRGDRPLPALREE